MEVEFCLWSTLDAYLVLTSAGFLKNIVLWSELLQPDLVCNSKLADRLLNTLYLWSDMYLSGHGAFGLCFPVLSFNCVFTKNRCRT